MPARGYEFYLRVEHERIKFISIKPGFHIIAPVVTITAVVEKRVSATVAIYGKTLFSDIRDFKIRDYRLLDACSPMSGGMDRV